jgi:NAD(P)-dependent dehydrogenase (short-subunit alcohol dehydrogenase family)
MNPGLHVIFGTGAIGLATFDALRRRGATVRLVNRSGRAHVPDGVDVEGGDAANPAFAAHAARGAAVAYQTLNPAYPEWTAQFPALQAAVLSAAESTGARLVSMENVYMYGRPDVPVRGTVHRGQQQNRNPGGDLRNSAGYGHRRNP